MKMDLVDGFLLGALAAAGGGLTVGDRSMVGLGFTAPMRQYAEDRGIPEEEVLQLIRRATARLLQMEGPE